MTSFLAEILNYLDTNAALVISWLIIFSGVLVLYILWLSYRISQASSTKGFELAKENRQNIHAVKAKLNSLDEYIRGSFTQDFGGAMKSFDNTVSSVLNQMKDELVQGVSRIEQIESAVSKKNILEGSVNQGEQSVKSLLTAPDEQIEELTQEEEEALEKGEPAKTSA